METDIVTLRVRTGKDEGFTYDSRRYTVTSKKGLKVERPVAELAIRQNALNWNPGTGEVENSLLYIEEDVEEPTILHPALPSTPLKPEDIEAAKNTDGLGDDTILVNGKPVKKTTIDFHNKYIKQNFVENNS